jgi:hypothetical protein
MEVELPVPNLILNLTLPRGKRPICRSPRPLPKPDDRRTDRSLSYLTDPRYLSSQLSDSFIISVRGTSCPVS